MKKNVKFQSRRVRRNFGSRGGPERPAYEPERPLTPEGAELHPISLAERQQREEEAAARRKVAEEEARVEEERVAKENFEREVRETAEWNRRNLGRIRREYRERMARERMPPSPVRAPRRPPSPIRPPQERPFRFLKWVSTTEEENVQDVPEARPKPTEEEARWSQVLEGLGQGQKDALFDLVKAKADEMRAGSLPDVNVGPSAEPQPSTSRGNVFERVGRRNFYGARAHPYADGGRVAPRANSPQPGPSRPVNNGVNHQVNYESGKTVVPGIRYHWELGCWNCGGNHNHRQCPHPRDHPFCHICGYQGRNVCHCPQCGEFAKKNNWK